MTQIERDAYLVLSALGKLTEGKNVDTTFVAGSDIEIVVHLTPERINDGAAFLDKKGYAIMMATLETQPFYFRWLQITLDGRIEYQRQKVKSRYLVLCKQYLIAYKWILGPAVLLIGGGIIAHSLGFHLSEINLPFVAWARNTVTVATPLKTIAEVAINAKRQEHSSALLHIVKSDKLKVGSDSVVYGNVPPGTIVGDRSTVVGATDSRGNTIINQPMAVGYNAHAGSGSIAIGTNAGAGNQQNVSPKSPPSK